MLALLCSALLLVWFDYDLWEHFPKPTQFSNLPNEHINIHQTQYRHLLIRKRVQIKNSPERVMDLCQYFHLVSHINISLRSHSLALLCSKTAVGLSSFSETCTAYPI